MSKQTVNQVIQRAISDAAFRRQLQRDPSSALTGFDLTKDERAAITSGDPTRLTALGVDQRMSKAFGLGALSEVSKTVIGDTGSAGSAAFIDEGSSAGTSAIVSPNTAEGGTMVVTDADAQSLAAGYTSGDGASSSVIVGDPQSGASAAIDVSAPTHLQTVEADLDSPDMRTVSDASAAAPTHLQTVEADLDSPDMRTVSDASAAGPTHLQTVEADLNSPDMVRSAFESLDTSGDANVLDPGIVGGTAGETISVDPSEGTQVIIVDQPTDY